MTYGIFSLESGSAIAWFDSEEAALDAARQIIDGEPDAVNSIGVATFDDGGHPEHAVQGPVLRDMLGLPAAAA